MLNHEPDQRPTAIEILNSPLLPLMEMEESEFQKALRNTLKNPETHQYKKLFRELFDQNLPNAKDYCYDLEFLQTNLALKQSFLASKVKTTLVSIFRRHCGIHLATDFLIPKFQPIVDFGCPAVQILDSSGIIVHLPYDLRVQFARFVARRGIVQLKRYDTVQIQK